jgi:hypothetical protein
MKDKWLSGENFLLYVDFADGTIRVNSGVSVGESSYLIYDKIGATPFDVVFEQDANGDLLLKVHTVLGDESFSIGAENLTGLPNLTDLTKCYLSFTPWAAQTSGSFDVTAVHGGDKDCLQYVKTDVDQPNDEPNAPDTSDDQNASDVATDDSSSSKTSSNKGSASSSNKKSSGCGNSVYSGAAALSLGVAGALLLKKKKENDREEIKANKS